MAISAFTMRRVDADSYVIEMADELGSIVVHVPVPRSHRDRIYTEAERLNLARLTAQEIALNFAESLLGDTEGQNANGR